MPADSLYLENESQGASSIHVSPPSFLEFVFATVEWFWNFPFGCHPRWVLQYPVPGQGAVCLLSAGGLEAFSRVVVGLVSADLLRARIPLGALIYTLFPLAGSNLHRVGHVGDITYLKTRGHLSRLSLSVAGHVLPEDCTALFPPFSPLSGALLAPGSAVGEIAGK